MLSVESTGMLLGGLGLLLMGMSLMTDGLKRAAGSALRDILADWTSNRGRGLIAGFLITAIVQSSSAITVATIGFANAGLLTLEQAMWVIFGSNVGTTMTGWIVALIGFKLNVEAFALPMVGIGVILKLTGEHSRRGAFGEAVIGFGLLFLGIGILKETFEVFGGGMGLPELEASGLVTVVVYVLIGVLLTTLMQSSSAALVIALSAAEGGLIPLQSAAAVVIGANLGTTTTALLAVWGATPTAKRVAVSHVMFNIVTASVAVLIMTPMLLTVGWLEQAFKLPNAPATTLAVFHTAFNILGVLLMWPFAKRLTGFLLSCFQTQEEVESRPRYLDRTSLGLPFIAGEALIKEILRIRRYAAGAVLTSMSAEHADSAVLDDDAQIVHNLVSAVGNYSAELSRSVLPPVIADMLPSLLRSAQQYATVTDLARDTIATSAQQRWEGNETVENRFLELRRQIVRLIGSADIDDREYDESAVAADYSLLDEQYEAFKNLALREGASGRFSVVRMDNALRHAALARRAARQFIKATRRMIAARNALSQGNSVQQHTDLAGGAPSDLVADTAEEHDRD